MNNAISHDVGARVFASPYSATPPTLGTLAELRGTVREVGRFAQKLRNTGH